MREASDRLVRVVHAQGHAGALEVVQHLFGDSAVFTGVHQLHLFDKPTNVYKGISSILSVFVNFYLIY